MALLRQAGRVAPPVDTRTVAVLAAMPNELRPLVRALSLRRRRSDGPEVWTDSVGGIRVVASTVGVGTSAAGAATDALLRSTTVDHVVVIGIAGALGPDPPVGGLVVPEVVLDGRSGRELRPAPVEGHPGHGTLHTSDEFILDPERLRRLRDAGVVALDMETAAIAEVCEAHGRPWSVVRAISDSAVDQPVGAAAIGLVKADGSPDLRAVARLLARRPGAVRGLARLARDSKVAALTSVRAVEQAYFRNGGSGPA